MCFAINMLDAIYFCIIYIKESNLALKNSDFDLQSLPVDGYSAAY